MGALGSLGLMKEMQSMGACGGPEEGAPRETWALNKNVVAQGPGSLEGGPQGSLVQKHSADGGPV